MDEPTFWRPLARARAASGGDLDEQVTRLTTRLAALSPAEIVAFDDLIWTMLTRAYRHDLWAAAYLINGGCSDDCFDSFIGWLIAPNGDSWANPGTRRRSSGSFRAWPPAASPPRGAAARAARPPARHDHRLTPARAPAMLRLTTEMSRIRRPRSAERGTHQPG